MTSIEKELLSNIEYKDTTYINQKFQQQQLQGTELMTCGYVN